jgi:hypothetical protein
VRLRAIGGPHNGQWLEVRDDLREEDMHTEEVTQSNGSFRDYPGPCEDEDSLRRPVSYTVARYIMHSMRFWDRRSRSAGEADQHEVLVHESMNLFDAVSYALSEWAPKDAAPEEEETPLAEIDDAIFDQAMHDALVTGRGVIVWSDDRPVAVRPEDQARLDNERALMEERQPTSTQIMREMGAAQARQRQAVERARRDIEEARALEAFMRARARAQSLQGARMQSQEAARPQRAPRETLASRHGIPHPFRQPVQFEEFARQHPTVAREYLRHFESDNGG